jgi:hypothetical protein
MSSTSCPLIGVICGPPVKPIFNSTQVVVDDHDRSVTYDKSWTSSGTNYEWESTTSGAGVGGTGVFRFSGMPHLVVFIPLSTLIAALLVGTSMSMYGTIYNNSATPAYGYCNVSYAMDSAEASIVPTPTSNLNETTFGALLYTVRCL